MLGYLLPIKKKWCDQIFNDQRKFFEFRKHFDKDFKGRCFVYESGNDGCHKVIGYFYTERIGYVRPGKELDEDFDLILDSVPEEKVDEVLNLGEPLYCIPIIQPVRFIRPLMLKEWSLLYRIDKVWTRPPQSRAKVNFDESIDFSGEGVKIEKYSRQVAYPFI